MKNTEAELKILNDLFIRNQYGIDRMANELSLMINDLRHSMNDQLIYLKYGNGVQVSYDDEILIRVV